EYVPRIMRSSRLFSVILYRKSFRIFHLYSFYRTVIQIHMCCFNLCRFLYLFCFSTKSVILRSDFTFTSCQVLYWMVQSPMTMVKLVSSYAISQRQQLMP